VGRKGGDFAGSDDEFEGKGNTVLLWGGGETVELTMQEPERRQGGGGGVRGGAYHLVGEGEKKE